MSEEEIAAKQAQKIPKEEPWINGHPPDDRENLDPQDPNVHNVFPLADSQATLEIQDYFALGVGARHNAETSEQLNEIIQWAKANAEEEGLAGILRTLRHTEVILGSTLKPDRLARIYRYIRIQQQKAVLAEKERAVYA